MRRKLRIAAATLVVFLGVLAIVAIVERDWTAAQLRAVAVLATTEDWPVLAWTVRAVTAEPRVTETVVGGAPSTVVRPGRGGGPWPTIVFVNGATRRGRHHPQVQRLARGLARAGFLVVVPDLPGLRLGAITPATTAATIRTVRAAADSADAKGGQVGLYGVSVGATLALLAAESPALARRVTVVGGEAPWVQLRRVIRLATTGLYDGKPYETDPYVKLALARSLAAGLPASPQRSRLLTELEAVDDDDPAPLAGVTAADYRGSAAALVRLLENREPQRFPALYGRLPATQRAAIRALSPIYAASRLRMPVELATAPHDKYFPPAESRALSRAAPNVRVTVTSTLDHAVPHFSAGDLVDLGRFDGFIVRYLRLARG
ncbi:MAG TPA: alpha/beta fold hydrolase [Gaiellaceae bacterium]|nr:alpha/beta fold hydrolase [Gaiellaceae bacterium]